MITIICNYNYSHFVDYTATGNGIHTLAAHQLEADVESEDIE